jgi:hypothetical protein
MRKQISRTLLTAILSLGLCQPAFAAFACTGKITNLALATDGSLWMSLHGPGVSLVWQNLCSQTGVQNGINPANCKSIYAMLLTAKTTDRNVVFSFDYAATSGTCDTTRFPPWSTMSTTAPTGGWYFGPEIQ